MKHTGKPYSGKPTVRFDVEGSGEIQTFTLLCNTVENFLSMMNIPYERIHPATPKEDAHIESFNSILEREVIRRFEFESFEEAQSTIDRFVVFYNNERLHSAIGYITSGEKNKKMYRKDSESLKSYKTILSAIREPDQNGRNS